MHVLIDTVYGRKPITIYIIQLQETDKKGCFMLKGDSYS